MAELSNYETVVNGIKTILRLSPADAKKRGLTRKQVVVVIATDPPVAPPATDPPVAPPATDPPVAPPDKGTAASKK